MLGKLISQIIASRIGEAAAKAAQRLAGGLSAGGLIRNRSGGSQPPAGAPSQPAPRSTIVQRIVQIFRVAANQPTPPPVQRLPQALIPQARANMSGLLAQRVARAPAGAASSVRLASAGASSGGGAAGAAGSLIGGRMAGMALANPVGAGLALAGVFVALTVAGKKLGESQVENQRNLSRFNGQMAQAYAHLRIGDIIRSRQSANATAGSTTALVGALNEFKDAARPANDLVTNTLNRLAMPVLKFCTGAIRVMQPMLDALNALVDDNKKKEEKLPPWNEMIVEVGKRYEQRIRPKPRDPRD